VNDEIRDLKALVALRHDGVMNGDGSTFAGGKRFLEVALHERVAPLRRLMH